MSNAEQQILRQSLRRLGGLAHQAQASLKAADRFMVQGKDGDHDTATWLVCTAMELTREVAEELDQLARGMRESGADPMRQQVLAAWRRIAHQLHAASRAADLYLEQESRDERDTGTWLVASTLLLAERLAGALDDAAGQWSAPAEPRRMAPVGIRGAVG